MAAASVDVCCAVGILPFAGARGKGVFLTSDSGSIVTALANFGTKIIAIVYSGGISGSVDSSNT